MDASTQLYRKSEVLTSTGTEPLLSPSLFTAHKPLLCPTPQVLNLLSQTLTSLLLLAWFGRRRGRPRLFSAATRTWSPESFTAQPPRGCDGEARRGGGGESRETDARCITRQGRQAGASSLRKWGAVVWCPRIEGFA